MEKITINVLKGWFACDEGLQRFGELFPDGADLETAVLGLVEDGRSDWAKWLVFECRNDARFVEQAFGGCGNAGTNNTGDFNTGDRNSGNENEGVFNSGDGNFGDGNSGARNYGRCNSGDNNSGNCNSGGCNSGSWNSGFHNSGSDNSGHCNSGSRNSGHFNTISPDEILVFNRPAKWEAWNAAKLPVFVSRVTPTYWVDYDEMTDDQKIEHPDAKARGGRLFRRTYKEAWRAAWDETTDADRRLVLSLPNFDADVFLEITGIDVRAVEKITTDVLKEWRACKDGFRRFAELFPDGTDLKTAGWRLIVDGHPNWTMWLHERCRKDPRFADQLDEGCGNTGFQSSGDWNSGEWNSGDYNSGHKNSGDKNSGSRNSGSYNSGGNNTGNGNTGDGNSGHGNSGNHNSGHGNSGSWNSGDQNSGHFNSTDPDEIRVFNKPIARSAWVHAEKPSFIYWVDATWWRQYDSMTDEQKAAHPEAEKPGGILVKRTYREAWRKAWDGTDDADRRCILGLPNFDPDVFMEITGIDVRKELGVSFPPPPPRAAASYDRYVVQIGRNRVSDGMISWDDHASFDDPDEAQGECEDMQTLYRARVIRRTEVVVVDVPWD